MSFMVGCKLFKTFLKYNPRKNAIAENCHPYVFKIILSLTGNNIDSSKNAVERSAYGGANFVPISVPITWLNVFGPTALAERVL